MKSERERSIEFLLGWMMEFGSQPVERDVFSSSPWWKKAVSELHQPHYNTEIAVCFTTSRAGAAQINRKGIKLLEEGK